MILITRYVGGSYDWLN